MSASRGLLAAAAAAGALVAASPSSAIDMSLRSPFLPPVDGSSPAESFSLARQGRDLIVAIGRDQRAVAILREHRARRLSDLIWLVQANQTSAALRRLEAIGALRYAHPNGKLRPNTLRATQGDPVDPAPWWLPQLGADRVPAPAAGFPLTIIDDGIDMTHPEFTARPVTYLNPNDVVPQEDYHGTMVTSVAAAPADGVGIAGLYPLANLRFADTGAGDCADVVSALEAAIAAGPSVVNMSWGFTSATCPALHDQIVRAFGAGILPVAATGNMRLHFSPPGIPAVLPHVLTVGSTDEAGRVSYFSNEGRGIDLSAPGEEIVVATPTFFDPSGFAELEGTSFSSSLVSAAGAWIATRRRMQVTQLSQLLRTSARDVGPVGWDVDTGFGIVNIPAALRRPLPAVDPLEPNDDVNQVKAGGLFKDAAPALTRPDRTRVTLRARLDRTEDPVDVYRVYIPPGQVARLRLAPSSNVDIELFHGSARTCFYPNRRRALRGALIRGSYQQGRAVDTVQVKNNGTSERYVFACIYKPREVLVTAAYSLSITTTKK